MLGSADFFRMKIERRNLQGPGTTDFPDITVPREWLPIPSHNNIIQARKLTTICHKQALKQA